MDINPAWLYKSLVVGVIVLFISVGIQPAIANVSVNKTSDFTDDCGCKDISSNDRKRVESLLIHLEAVTNSIMLKYGHIPGVREKCEKVLDFIYSDDLWHDFCDNLALFIIELMYTEFPWFFLVFIITPIILILIGIWIIACMILPFFFYNELYNLIKESILNLYDVKV